MPNAPLFASSYPRPGSIALICEGDVVGYEKAFLDLWVRERAGTDKGVKDPDIWPCGTREALSGMADAVGRSAYVIVVEDRDFRLPADAAAECESKLKDRERRGVAMRAWMTWRRNEFENYFLDPKLLVPTAAKHFECSEADVEAALGLAVRQLLAHQASAYVRAAARAKCGTVEPAWDLGPTRPQFTVNGPQPPDPAKIRDGIRQACAAWSTEVGKALCKPGCCDELTSLYDQRLAAWQNLTPASPEVLADWAGKEVLQFVRQYLASKFAAPAVYPQPPTERLVGPTRWHTLNREKRDEQDRAIERAMQKPLVDALWRHTEENPSSDMAQSLLQIEQLL